MSTNALTTAARFVASIQDYMDADQVPMEFQSTYMASHVRCVLTELLNQLPPTHRANLEDWLTDHNDALKQRTNMSLARNIV